MSVGSQWLVAGGFGLGLMVLTLACGPSAAQPTPGAPTPDPFTVVRATSQAAYATGQAYLSHGDTTSLVQGCTLIDTAKTTDPDNRPDVNQALDRCKVALSALLATEAPTAGPLPTLVLPTLPAATAPPATPAAAPPKPTGGPTTAQATPAGALQPRPGATAAGNLTSWRDPQGRFTIAAPSDWATTEQPQTLFGTGVVAFHDPTNRAVLDVSVDNATKAVSPELYAATMDVVMAQQVPGYAGEQVVPGTTAGNPSIRRVFTFTAKDATGRDMQQRGFQVALLKGSTPYIISGSAPADQFQQYSPTFDRVVASFQFS